MDSDECPEEQCIAIIQELLQVEYFFQFKIIKSGNFLLVKKMEYVQTLQEF